MALNIGPDKLLIRSVAIILSVIFIFLVPVSGQDYGQSFNVVSVEVKGAVTASTDLIRSVSGINPGDQLTAAITQDAVKRLYQLGIFRDVRIDAEEVTGGLKVIIVVDELPKLTEYEFRGNKEIKDKDLEKKLDLKTGVYLSPNMVFEKRQELLDLYGEKGYFLATVESRETYNDDSTEADLIFDIKERSKVKVEKVVVTGNKRVEAGDIVGKMRNRKRGLFLSSNFDKEKYPEDKEKIINYLHQEGYIDAYLKSDSFVVDTSRNRMTIYLDIYEGPRYYFGKTEFSGNEVIPSDRLEGVLKYRENDVFNLEKFEESTYEVYFAYQEIGYLHVRVVDDRKTRDSLIDINFDIIEGLPSEVNFVKIKGNTKTKEFVIRREMPLHPGQVFHRSLLIRSIRNIMQLNYFANVTPEIVDLPSGDVDIVVDVEEKPTGQVSAGAGYSGQDKFVGTFGMGIPNFRGMGQALNFSVDIGSELNSYSVSFTEPWAFGTPTSAGLDLYYLNRRWYDDYTEGRRGGSVRLGRRLTWPDDYFRVYTRYRLEDDRFYDFSEGYTLTHSELTRQLGVFDSVYVNPETGAIDSIGTISYIENKTGTPLPGSLQRFNEKWFSASSLQFRITRDTRNLPEFATEGSILSYTVEFTGGILGGYWEYSKHDLEISKFIPVIWKTALAGKLALGVIRASNDNRILEYDRYSPGGTSYDGFVRGYDDLSLTPDTSAVSQINYEEYKSDVVDQRPDFEGTPDTSYTTRTTYKTRVRGKYLLVANLEYQVPIIENQLYGLLFFDAGNSWLDKDNIRLRDVYRGVGVGFRLVVPGIGTIGFDFGYPLDEREGQDKKWKPHFQIGTTFR